MSSHWEPVYHPQRRPKPPQYRRIPTHRRPTIGEERAGIFDCYEFTYYYVYLNDKVPSSNRLFELRLRVPLKAWQSARMIEKTIAGKADDLMTNKGINVADFDKKSVGIRKVGTTSSERARYLLINKRTKQTWPKEDWGYV